MNSYAGPYGQVLTNLVLNAAVHAFPDGGRGSVHIVAQALGKDKVEVLFSDDGCGMSPEVRRQVFDPFFTTRRDQGSTGLGLHIVHNIVTNRLGGRINLESKPGAGNEIPHRGAARGAAGSRRQSDVRARHVVAIHRFRKR